MTFVDILGTGVEQPPEQPGVVPPAQVQAQVPPEAAPAGGGFMDKLKNDQAFAQAAIMMGARMMQGPRPGQDAFGALGDAAMIGTQAYNMGKQNEIDNQRMGERAAVLNDQTRAQTAGAQAVTAGKTQENAENLLTQGDRVRSLRLKAQALERAGKVAEAQQIYDMAKAEFMSKQAAKNPAQMEQLWQEELRAPVEDAKSKRALQGAQAGYYDAAAGNQSAQADRQKAETENPEKFRRSGSQGAMVQSREQLKQMYKEANPGATDQQINQMVLDHENTSKRKAVGDSFIRFVTDGGYDLSKPGEAAKAKAAYENAMRITDELVGGKAQTAPKPAPTSPGVKSAQPTTISTEDEWKALAPGTPYIFNGKKGIR